jgi:hypothetical protein
MREDADRLEAVEFEMDAALEKSSQMLGGEIAGDWRFEQLLEKRRIGECWGCVRGTLTREIRRNILVLVERPVTRRADLFPNASRPRF